uniref:EOG090X0FVK n=1 Tax=Daphnia sinensis TaxID=1820382 RepID=A0A4Y7NCH0_9CRUS|nr:EOG090X0FVK [Daphnia sinensis]SVE92089.1 EOG090X0FVK [Daphnia sinensis]
MVAPRVSSDEEESDLIRLPKDTAAQEMEIMTKPIVTQFGFADSQFNDSEDQLRPQPETLANIALPQEGDELTQQSELFEQVCNERMHTRPKTLNDDGDDDDDEDNETWLQSRRRSSENASTVRPELASDEDNTIADVANDSMDIDSLDPKPTEAYQPTLIEQMANIVSHGACILPAVYATWLLIQRATTPTQFWAGLIYGIALILLFTVSAAFHTTCCLCNNSKYLQIREVLHRGDRAMIYIFIASSYFPWLSLVPNLNITAEVTNKSSSSLLPTLLSWCGVSSLIAADLRWLVWFLAAMGILYQQIFHEKYKWLETLIYVLIGLLPSLPFVHGDEFQGVWELKLGGACYIIGLIFFKADGRIPLAHAIWHIHVALGASIHYYAVFSYLIG